MSKPLIIFDFDGTICDSYRLFVKVIDTLAPIYRFKSSKQVNEKLLRSEPADRVMKALGISYWKLPFILTHARFLFRKDHHALKMFEDIYPTLEKLKARGYRLCILTTNAKPNLQLVMGSQIEIFDEISDKAGLFSKPRRLRQIVKRHGLESQRDKVFYVGDEARDILAAQKAHIKAVAVTWGYNSKELLESLQPDHLVEKTIQLENLFQEAS